MIGSLEAVPSTVRSLLAPEYAVVSDERLEQLLSESVGATGLDDVEDFLGVVGDIGQAIVQALPVVLPMLGAVAGPAGAVAGGAIGTAVAAGAAPPQTSTPRRPGTRAKALRRRASAAPAPPGSIAAAQLLSLLFRPEIQQALLAMALGDIGRRHLVVDETPVPVAAFTNLLAVLAQQAGLEYARAVRDEGERLPAYLLDGSGELRCDIAVPEERAGVLWNMLSANGGAANDGDMLLDAWSALAVATAAWDDLDGGWDE